MSSRIYLIAIFIGLFIAVAAIISFLDRRRTQAIEKAANDLGMTFERKPPHPPGGQFELMQRGRHRKARNLIRGPIEDLQVELFDYAYTTGSGKHSTTHRQSVALLHMPDAQVPKFILSPERFFDKVAAVLGFDDINFEDDPVFSKRFLLKSGDASAMQAIFTPEFRASMVNTSKELCVEAFGNMVIVYRRSRRTKPEEISARLTEAFDIATRIWAQAAR